ncbi:MAG: type II toxin-antitoxin system PemK/MazF family toxin [Treponema sp.]|nr:type II toxin-antitoxin system PemK/MazF family toxin [Treponema sp.]
MIRGEIWWVDFGIPYGSEPGHRRPALVIQDNSFNASDMNTTVVIPLTTNLGMAEYPCNEFLSADETGLPKDSVVLTPQIGVIDKTRMEKKILKLSSTTMRRISRSVMQLLNLENE